MCDVGIAVADITGAILAGDLRSGHRAPCTEHISHEVGDLTDGIRRAATDIEDFTLRTGHLQRQATGACNIVNADEIALLITMFIDERWIAVQEAGSED